MEKLSTESAIKLQKILSKRAGRELTKEELEQAYCNLMGFAQALIELDEPELEKPLAKAKGNNLQYV